MLTYVFQYYSEMVVTVYSVYISVNVRYLSKIYHENNQVLSKTCEIESDRAKYAPLRFVYDCTAVLPTKHALRSRNDVPPSAGTAQNGKPVATT